MRADRTTRVYGRVLPSERSKSEIQANDLADRTIANDRKGK